MKKTMAILLATALIFSALVFTACSSGGGMSFISIGELKKSGTEYDFLKANSSLEDDLLVCQLAADASGEITVPAEKDGKKVVAVISEGTENDKATALTLEEGVKFIENCFKDSSAVATLTLPGSFKEVYHSFNHNSALTEVVFGRSAQYIVDSFNECDKLAKVELSSYIYEIDNSFRNDKALADVTVTGAVQKLGNSFNGSGVAALTFAENVHDIYNCFNECPALKTVTFEQIAGGVSNSFNKCAAHTELTFKQGSGRLFKSFCDNENLEKTDFGGNGVNNAESFENSPKVKLPEQ